MKVKVLRTAGYYGLEKYVGKVLSAQRLSAALVNVSLPGYPGPLPFFVGKEVEIIEE